MMRHSKISSWLSNQGGVPQRRRLVGLLLLTAFMISLNSVVNPLAMSAAPAALLTDPFLQLPTADSVNVVWFTEFAGKAHRVSYGRDLEHQVEAVTTQLSRAREDSQSRITNPPTTPTPRPIWRHEARVTGLETDMRSQSHPPSRIPYRVTSVTDQGEVVQSRTFTLAPAPPRGTDLKILLTSDHQLMPMTTANLQKVEETIGRVDAVFLAGDLVNIPDRASEWFDDQRGGAFFPALQGRGHYQLEKDDQTTTYRGGEIIQHAPLFVAVGNHEVMGRFSDEKSLNRQFSDAVPRAIAAQRYTQQESAINPQRDPAIRQAWIKSASFNTDTVEEIFSLPTDRSDGKNYYAVSLGDIRLIVLYATNIWRVPNLEPNGSGRYVEASTQFNQPEQWGYGQHIFEPIAKGSEQYNWLVNELKRPEFQQARYKIVMFHHPPHTLGGNIVPAYTDPVQVIERDNAGQITAIRYEYPKDQDYLIRDLVPLLEESGVQLVYFGHSHIWNRFQSASGLHFLESSNVGNTYQAYFLNGKSREVPDQRWQEDYVAVGDPNGLEPMMPNLNPVLNAETHEPLPYIASNDITVFSILETKTGTISSYRFDTRLPNSPVTKFDEFNIASAHSERH